MADRFAEPPSFDEYVVARGADLLRTAWLLVGDDQRGRGPRPHHAGPQLAAVAPPVATSGRVLRRRAARGRSWRPTCGGPSLRKASRPSARNPVSRKPAVAPSDEADCCTRSRRCPAVSGRRWCCGPSTASSEARSRPPSTTASPPCTGTACTRWRPWAPDLALDEEGLRAAARRAATAGPVRRRAARTHRARMPAGCVARAAGRSRWPACGGRRRGRRACLGRRRRRRRCPPPTPPDRRRWRAGLARTTVATRRPDGAPQPHRVGRAGLRADRTRVGLVRVPATRRPGQRAARGRRPRRWQPRTDGAECADLPQGPGLPDGAPGHRRHGARTYANEGLACNGWPALASYYVGPGRAGRRSGLGIGRDRRRLPRLPVGARQVARATGRGPAEPAPGHGAGGGHRLPAPPARRSRRSRGYRPIRTNVMGAPQLAQLNADLARSGSKPRPGQHVHGRARHCSSCEARTVDGRLLELSSACADLFTSTGSPATPGRSAPRPGTCCAPCSSSSDGPDVPAAQRREAAALSRR